MDHVRQTEASNIRIEQTQTRRTSAVSNDHLAPSLQFIEHLRRRSPGQTPPLPYFSPFENDSGFFQPNVDLALSPHSFQPVSSQHLFQRSGAPSPQPLSSFPPRPPASGHPSPHLDLNVAPSSPSDLVRLSLALPINVNSSTLTSYFRSHLNVKISNVSLSPSIDRTRFHGSFDTDRELWENGELLERIRRAEQQGFVFNLQSGRGWTLRLYPVMINPNSSRKQQYQPVQKRDLYDWIRLTLRGFSIEIRKDGVEEILKRFLEYYKDLELFKTSRRVVRIAGEEEEIEEIVVVKVSVGGEESAQLLEREFGKYAYGGTLIEVSREEDHTMRGLEGLSGIGDGLITRKEKKTFEYSRDRGIAKEDQGRIRRYKPDSPFVSYGNGRPKDGGRFRGRYFTWPKTPSVSSSSGDEGIDSEARDPFGLAEPRGNAPVDKQPDRRRTRQIQQSRSRSRSSIRRSLSPRSRRYLHPTNSRTSSPTE
ncbi:hypothetical protein JCM5350_005206 [Sporobolomyces pararoseus]